MSIRTFIPSRVRQKYDALEMTVLVFVGKLPLHRARIAGIRAFGGQVDRTAIVYHGFEIRHAKKLTIGARTNVGNGAILDARGGLFIGSDVNLSTGVNIWTAQHEWNSEDMAYEAKPVRLGDRCWLGPRVTILPGVVVGEGAVVAAGAVVASDVPPFALVGGVPARRIADRRTDLRYELGTARQKTWWW